MPTDQRHRLSEQDRANLTATCSVCGPGVEIMRKGKYGLACREGDRAAKRRYKQSHPERVRQDKRRPASRHRLAKRDGSRDICSVCGPVDPVVLGRGYGCPNRAAELGWKKFAETPAARCECGVYLDRAGKCPSCDTRENWDLGYAIKLQEHRERRDLEVMAWRVDLGDFAEDDHLLGYGFHDGETPLPQASESAVQGWKTIGRPDEFKGVRPEYAKLYGAGRR